MRLSEAAVQDGLPMLIDDLLPTLSSNFFIRPGSGSESPIIDGMKIIPARVDSEIPTLYVSRPMDTPGGVLANVFDRIWALALKQQDGQSIGREVQESIAGLSAAAAKQERLRLTSRQVAVHAKTLELLTSMLPGLLDRNELDTAEVVQDMIKMVRRHLRFAVEEHRLESSQPAATN